MFKNLLIFLITIFIFAGCSTKEVTPIVDEFIIEKPVEDSRAWVKKALYKEYGKWSDTPYRFGGKSVKGMDCSFLVQTVYYDAFGIKLPRATDEQVKVGYEIPRNSIQEGDIVFFKTGKTMRHSGIIIDKGKFLHSSTIEGVTISHLNNPYWKAKYWQTRRVLP